MSPSADKPFVLRVTDLAYRDIMASAHASLAEAMVAGEGARRKVPTLQRRYAIVSLNGERWELTGGLNVAYWRKE